MRAPDRKGLTPWRARLLRRAGLTDLGFGLLLAALATLAVWAGDAAARHLSPLGARTVSELLDELELPKVLPNAVLVANDGSEATLWELTTGPRTIVAFYAPWCGPCQQELPVLANHTPEHEKHLVVVVGRDEDPVEVDRKLDNLGLGELRYHVDATGLLQAGGRVTALPTTFLVGRNGRVEDRIVGQTEYRLYSMISEVEDSIEDGQ